MSEPIQFPDRGLQPAEAQPNELLISGLQLLRVTEKDFVVIRTPLDKLEDGSAKAIMASLQKYCERQKLKGVSVCLLPAGTELMVMNEEQMNALGWKRASLLELATKMPSISPRA